jgi:hydroxymethylpyrimidine/phosphomethylpyrimidine kinase
MKKIKKLRCVAAIAGTDPTGGAGLQADIKTISAIGCYAASIVTALVAQNTQGVQAIQEVLPAFIEKQIDSVFDDLTIDAVKIGMLHNTAVIKVVAAALKKFQPASIVLDPVMVAKDGSALLDLTTIDYLKENLFPLVTLITPNLFEAEKIVQRKISHSAEMELAAIEIGQQANTSVLVKGGHFTSPQSADVVYMPQTQQCHWFYANRIETLNTHGTGCTLSSAIASFLAQDYGLLDAIAAAKKYLSNAIAAGSTLQLGKGRGPVDHFYFLRKNNPSANSADMLGLSE